MRVNESECEFFKNSKKHKNFRKFLEQKRKNLIKFLYIPQKNLCATGNGCC